MEISIGRKCGNGILISKVKRAKKYVEFERCEVTRNEKCTFKKGSKKCTLKKGSKKSELKLRKGCYGLN